jgi:hypothetical protein
MKIQPGKKQRRVTGGPQRPLATRHSSLATVLLAFCLLAFPCLKSATSQSIALLILAPTLLACFPLLAQWNERKQAQRATERATWKTQYQASPQSRPLQFGDSD